MKIIIAILMLTISTLANTFNCPFDESKNQDAQIRSCKLNILRTECEQLKIHIQSSTTVNNYLLESDQIKTNAECNSLNIIVSDVKRLDESIQVKYKTITNGKVQAVSIENWNQIGIIKAHATAMQRQDSSKVISIAIDVDSQDAMRKADIMKKIAKKALLMTISMLDQ